MVYNIYIANYSYFKLSPLFTIRCTSLHDLSYPNGESLRILSVWSLRFSPKKDDEDERSLLYSS